MTATATVPTRQQAPTHPRAILAIILVSYFLILLDNSVVFTGLPSIEEGLDLSPVGLSWVQDAVGDAADGAALEAGVVLDADAGEEGDLLAA